MATIEPLRYADYLRQKLTLSAPAGLDMPLEGGRLFEWQRVVTGWALRQGRAALFEDCGLGKTPQQLVWADHVSKATGRPVLILAPLAVSQQTRREGVKFGVEVAVCEGAGDVRPGVNITNYEKLARFDPAVFAGIVLDESSILKAYMGKTKRLLCEMFKDTPYRLACTATPAPNDLMELLNHAEFLGIMRSSEALSVWFIADQKNSGSYKLKGHAEKDFWRWVASWAVCIERPSDIGFPDDGYELPALHERDVILPVDTLNEDLTLGFFRDIDLSATGFYKERSRTVRQRAARCAEIALSTDDQYAIWCGTNEEADELRRLLPQAAEIRGSDNPARKEQAALAFVDGDVRVMISKASIFGYGLNFQQCANTIFCGLDYSYEGYYQTVRRFYRFGQRRPVQVWRVLGSTERGILDVIARKQQQKGAMAKSMAEHMRALQTQTLRGHSFKLELAAATVRTPDWLRSEAI